MTKVNTRKRFWWISVAVWILLAGVLSALAPGGKEFVVANKDGGLPSDAASIIAAHEVEKYFPNDGGLPLFAVFHAKQGFSEEEITETAKAVE